MVGLKLNTYRAGAQSPVASPAGGGPKGGEGTLVVSLSGDPLSFNPNYQADDNIFVPGLNIYDTLVALDSSYQTIPALAQTWEVAEDGLTLTFHMVEGATWHDGEPVTSADVKYTFDTLIANEGLSGTGAIRVVLPKLICARSVVAGPEKSSKMTRSPALLKT